MERIRIGGEVNVADMIVATEDSSNISNKEGTHLSLTKTKPSLSSLVRKKNLPKANRDISIIS